jgi:UDP-N-acetylglucosamine diphosphorylase / glucose-1-phosphate thymidylyltransferase / UDP-N-acetylgalactosamine diphosphorylase / glucosamine-1-phosphate N-acetyltransferase / galactosamine-1-phosphate N-acetyltransferase
MRGLTGSVSSKPTLGRSKTMPYSPSELKALSRESPAALLGKSRWDSVVLADYLPVKASDFFTLPPSLAAFAAHFPPEALPWEWLRQIGPALRAQSFDQPLSARPPGVHFEGAVFLHPTVKLPPTATIIGPAWIGAGTEIRPGAYLRGNVIVGEACVLGNACEFKNCLLMDHVHVPHFSYVGDSILGDDAHFGAGVICSNFRLDHEKVIVRTADATYDSGLRKFGAIVGAGAEVGCNAVLNPGTLLGPRSLVMPTISFSGHLPAATIAKTRQTVTFLPRRD